MTQLPHKLSELAQIALDDLARVEALPDVFRVDMGNWLIQQSTGVCVVCAAGAVMSMRLGATVPAGQRLDHPAKISQCFGDNARSLFAIDMLRRGWVGAAIKIIESGDAETAWWDIDDQDAHALSRELPEYEEGPQIWRDEMTRLIADLREAGL